MLRGKGAWSLTLILLQMWELCSGTDEDCGRFYPWADGYVMPCADSPMDEDNVGAHVNLQIINSARDYVFITTPYLIIDGSMLPALTLSAQSGVDVRIIMLMRCL